MNIRITNKRFLLRLVCVAREKLTVKPREKLFLLTRAPSPTQPPLVRDISSTWCWWKLLEAVLVGMRLGGEEHEEGASWLLIQQVGHVLLVLVRGNI